MMSLSLAVMPGLLITAVSKQVPPESFVSWILLKTVDGRPFVEMEAYSTAVGRRLSFCLAEAMQGGRYRLIWKDIKPYPVP